MTKICLKVKPGARKNQVIKKEDGSFAVSVTAPPKKGKANKAVIRLLTDYFGIAKSKIRVISGATSKNKIAEVSDA
ncbi:MAG: hypothetical protein UX07_C0004G0031 [Parcubacteria group bacterium GW2011_GWA2_45_30]|nr:MAG: hypothetical protein UX07_C0004G0031 [Parcubacteria group bacterium GW2011_GWA2_45_30]